MKDGAAMGLEGLGFAAARVRFCGAPPHPSFYSKMSQKCFVKYCKNQAEVKPASPPNVPPLLFHVPPGTDPPRRRALVRRLTTGCRRPSSQASTLKSLRPRCAEHADVLFYIERNKNINLVLYSHSGDKVHLAMPLPAPTTDPGGEACAAGRACGSRRHAHRTTLVTPSRRPISCPARPGRPGQHRPLQCHVCCLFRKGYLWTCGGRTTRWPGHPSPVPPCCPSCQLPLPSRRPGPALRGRRPTPPFPPVVAPGHLVQGRAAAGLLAGLEAQHMDTAQGHMSEVQKLKKS